MILSPDTTRTSCITCAPRNNQRFNKTVQLSFKPPIISTRVPGQPKILPKLAVWWSLRQAASQGSSHRLSPYSRCALLQLWPKMLHAEIEPHMKCRSQGGAPGDAPSWISYPHPGVVMWSGGCDSSKPCGWTRERVTFLKQGQQQCQEWESRCISCPGKLPSSLRNSCPCESIWAFYTALYFWRNIVTHNY